jgi:tetratricopeptide (TPR) repeat protein
LGLFSFKKEKDQPKSAAGASPAEKSDSTSDSPFSAEKAERFFNHADTVHQTGSYEYAVQSWLQGLQKDPGSKRGIEGFFKSISALVGEGDGKKGVSKEVVKVISGKSDVDRFLLALLEYGQKFTDPPLCVRAFEMASKLGLQYPTQRLGDLGLKLCVGSQRPRKDLLVKLAEGFEKSGMYDRAVVAYESAYKVDPTDGELGQRIRQMAASATMVKGGYEKAGEQGGFRQNIRDADKQRQLEAQDRVVKTEQTIELLITAAEKEMVARPGDLPTIEKLAKLYLERAGEGDEDRAYDLLMKTYTETKQFRFREMAGDIRIRQARRKANDLKKRVEADPESGALKSELDAAMKALGELEVSEHKLRVEAYPTDLTRKFGYGERLFLTEKYDDAIAMFQESQNDPRLRSKSLALLGQCFFKTGWLPEAIETFRGALEIRENNPELQMELSYMLMLALKNKGAQERDLASAEEAEKIASEITRKQITYRDIRLQREELKKLVAALRGGGQGGAASVPA